MRLVNTKGYNMLYLIKRSNAMKPLKTKVSITLDSEIIDTIKLLAEQDDRSFSQYVNLVLKEYLKEKNKISNIQKNCRTSSNEN